MIAFSAARREIDSCHQALVQMFGSASRREIIKGYAASKRKAAIQQAEEIADAVVEVREFATGQVVATLRGPRDATVRDACQVAIDSGADVCVTVDGKYAYWSHYWSGFLAGDEAQYTPAWA